MKNKELKVAVISILFGFSSHADVSILSIPYDTSYKYVESKMDEITKKYCHENSLISKDYPYKETSENKICYRLYSDWIKTGGGKKNEYS
jgi:hypothetical protein